MVFDKKGYILILVLLGLFPLICTGQQQDKVAISVNSGYQVENFGWSIAGNLNGQNPNIYSELKWDHLQQLNTSAGIKWPLYHNFYFVGEYNHNFILGGKVSDTDYGSDNRTTPIYHDNFQDNRGYTDGAALGLGITAVNNKKWLIAFESGYTFSHQSLYLLGLNGQNSNLNTTYFTTGKGVSVTGSIQYSIAKKFRVEARLTYSQLNYQARANWNLIEQFAHPVSYRDNASGYNLQCMPAIIYQVSKHSSINLSGGISHSQTGTGIDRLYLANGNQEETQFNGAQGNTLQLVAGLTTSF